MKPATAVIAIAAVVAIVCAAAFMLNGRDDANDETQPEKVEGTLILKVDGTEVPVKWEDNASVDAIRAMAKDGLTVDTHRYGGFEQVGPLGKSVSRNDSSMTSSPSDIFLYSGNQIVLFFGENTYSYTALGKIDLPESDIVALLDKDSAEITLSIK